MKVYTGEDLSPCAGPLSLTLFRIMHLPYCGEVVMNLVI